MWEKFTHQIWRKYSEKWEKSKINLHCLHQKLGVKVCESTKSLNGAIRNFHLISQITALQLTLFQLFDKTLEKSATTNIFYVFHDIISSIFTSNFTTKCTINVSSTVYQKQLFCHHENLWDTNVELAIWGSIHSTNICWTARSIARMDVLFPSPKKYFHFFLFQGASVMSK